MSDRTSLRALRGSSWISVGVRRFAAALVAVPRVLLCVAALGFAGSADAQPSATPAPAASPVQVATPAPAASPAQVATPAPAAGTPATPPAATPAATEPATPAPGAEPTPEQREGAREAYTRGQALFAQGNFAEAKVAFEQAYAALPNPVVLLSTAECDVRLGKLDDAYTTLQQYLAQRPDAPDRAEVETKLADLLATPAHLVVTSEPTGAVVQIDGADSGRVTPADIEVARGDHMLLLSLPGYVPANQPISARIGARHEIVVVLHAAPPPSPSTDLKVQEGSGRPTTALWITSIVGAVGLVTGTVLGFTVLAERSNYDANPTKAAADRGERLALFTDVAFGVGAMALVTSAVLYLTADDMTAAHAASPQDAALQLAPSASAHGAGLSARGRF